MAHTAALLLGPVLEVPELVPGAHAVLLCPSEGVASTGLAGRRLGWVFRDSLLCLLPEAQVLVSLLFRVPPLGDVSSNVLQQGAGALAVDASRVYTDWQEADRPDTWKRSGYTSKPDASKIAAPPGQGIQLHPGGRWPTNVAFVHSSKCTQHQGVGPKAAWVCTQGCPVLNLNGQSGERRSTGTHPSEAQAGSKYRLGQEAYQAQGFMYSDAGGAARFYPQFATVSGLVDWLVHLIAADPEGCLVTPSLAQRITYYGTGPCVLT